MKCIGDNIEMKGKGEICGCHTSTPPSELLGIAIRFQIFVFMFHKIQNLETLNLYSYHVFCKRCSYRIAIKVVTVRNIQRILLFCLYFLREDSNNGKSV